MLVYCAQETAIIVFVFCGVTDIAHIGREEHIYQTEQMERKQRSVMALHASELSSVCCGYKYSTPLPSLLFYNCYPLPPLPTASLLLLLPYNFFLTIILLLLPYYYTTTSTLLLYYYYSSTSLLLLLFLSLPTTCRISRLNSKSALINEQYMRREDTRTTASTHVATTTIEYSALYLRYVRAMIPFARRRCEEGLSHISSNLTSP